MQKLHLVGLTTDLSGLIFSARKGSKSGGYVVPVDARLLAVIADTVSRRNGDAATIEAARDMDVATAPAARPEPPPAPPRPPRPTSALNPREIQARLRAGRAVDEVAKEAGVDAAWVDRFAAPILAEQGRIVDRAVALVYTKPRVGTSALPVAASVRRNLVARGVRLTDDEFNGGWTAYHLEDARWVVRFRYTSRARSQVAEWELDDVDDAGLVARNRLGGQLAHVTSARRRPRVTSSPPAAPSRAAAKKRPLVAKKVTAASKRSGAVKKRGATKKSSTAKKGATMKRAPARPRPRSAR